MRGHTKVDDSQQSIVDALRRCSCRVLVLSRVGHGTPDLLVGTPRGRLIFIECKTDGKNATRLTPEQDEFHRDWRRFPIFICRTPQQALDAIGHDCAIFDIDRAGVRRCSECGRELGPGDYP